MVNGHFILDKNINYKLEDAIKRTTTSQKNQLKKSLHIRATKKKMLFEAEAALFLR